MDLHNPELSRFMVVPQATVPMADTHRMAGLQEVLGEILVKPCHSLRSVFLKPSCGL